MITGCGHQKIFFSETKDKSRTYSSLKVKPKVYETFSNFLKVASIFL